MNPRTQRLQRLLHLREQLHDAAPLNLRVAHGALQAAEAGYQQARRASSQARERQAEALAQGLPEDWLLSCADAEFYHLARTGHARRITAAGLTVQAAMNHELAARRERRQMEVTLASLRRQDRYQAAQAEQKTLDETARRLIRSSPGFREDTAGNRPPWPPT